MKIVWKTIFFEIRGNWKRKTSQKKNTIAKQNTFLRMDFNLLTQIRILVSIWSPSIYLWIIQFFCWNQRKDKFLFVLEFKLLTQGQFDTIFFPIQLMLWVILISRSYCSNFEPEGFWSFNPSLHTCQYDT